MLGTNILNVFGKSPIKPMQKHMEGISRCVQTLIPFFTAVLEQDWTKAQQEQARILELESSADEIKKQIRLKLSSTLLMPVARTDLLGLLTAQDKIASKAKHIASLVLGRQMVFPDIIAQGYMQFITRAVDATLQAQKAIDELDELLEVGFGGREAKAIEKMVVELDNIERETDTLQMQIRQELFNIEQTLAPVNVIFLYMIIDWTGGLADRAQHVGHRLEYLLA